MGDWLGRLDADGSSLAAYRAKRLAVVAVAATYVLFWMWLAFIVGFCLLWVPANYGGNSWETHGTRPALVVGLVAALVAGIAAAAHARAVWVHGTATALSAVGAVRAEPGRHRALLNVVEELSIAAGQEPPAVFVIETSALNAFSTSDRGRPRLAVTTRLCEDLTRPELAAVVAHELTHLRSHDGILEVFVGELLRPMSETEDTLTRNPRAILLFLPALLCKATASATGRFAASGQAGLTDLSSIELTRDPESLAAALAEMSRHHETLGDGETAVARLLMVPPHERGIELRRRIEQMRELAV
jgi:heat shock protein HtpX